MLTLLNAGSAGREYSKLTARVYPHGALELEITRKTGQEADVRLSPEQATVLRDELTRWLATPGVSAKVEPMVEGSL